jgi:beta-lactam-binding protein with PASTA domain
VKAPARPGLKRSWRPRVPKRVATYFNERQVLKYVILTGLAGFLVGYLFIALFFFPFGRSPIVTIPDLRGRTEAQARRALGNVGLEMEKGGALVHPGIRAGRVLAQVPLPGQEASRGSAVSIILSSGAEKRAIPSIAGLGKDDAVALLRQMGFSVRLRQVFNNSPEGKILGMSPRAGTQVPMPGVVILTLSAGPPKVLVPGVVALSEADARARLQAAGLRLGTVTYDPLSAEPAGAILAQTPAAGDSLRMGSSVRVTVAGEDPTPEPIAPEPTDSVGPAEEPAPDEPDEPAEEPEPTPAPAPRDTVRLPRR